VKRASSSIGPFIIPAVCLIFLALCLVSGCLYSQNRQIKNVNRQLIIENDSIISVNIELRNHLEKRALSPARNSFSFKEEDNK
jgi:hypothetical protein